MACAVPGCAVELHSCYLVRIRGGFESAQDEGRRMLPGVKEKKVDERKMVEEGRKREESGKEKRPRIQGCLRG